MKKAVRILGCFFTVCLTIGLLVPLTNLTERKSSDSKYADFFRDRDYDVLFMGSSHVINGVFPMELWNEYGITSYNFGGHSNYLPTTYWVMENALDYVTPEVIVIDCLMLSSDLKGTGTFSYLHQSLDAFPLSLKKIKAVWDLLDDPAFEKKESAGNTGKREEPRTRIGLLWDFSVYHSRWNELTKDDFMPSSNKEKGAESRIAVVPAELKKIDPDIVTEPDHVGETYLCKMIESCQKRGINVVLMYLPFPASEIQQADANAVYDIAEDFGVPYINFLDLEGIIDYQTDLSDENSHVNPSGARKITSYLGQFLAEQYNLRDKRNEPDYSYWNTDYKKYEALKKKNLVKQEDMVKYLMLLSGDNTDTVFYVQNKDIFHNKLIMDLLRNTGINTDELNGNTDFILVNNQKKEAVVLDNFTEEGSTEKTIFGDVAVSRIKNEEEGTDSLVLAVNNQERIRIEENSNPGMQINVYRHGDLVDSVYFVYTVNPSTTKIKTLSVAR